MKSGKKFFLFLVAISALGFSIGQGSTVALAATPTPFPTPVVQCSTVSASKVIVPTSLSRRMIAVKTTNAGLVYLEFGPQAVAGSAAAFTITNGQPWNDPAFPAIAGFQLSAKAVSSSWVCVSTEGEFGGGSGTVSVTGTSTSAGNKTNNLAAPGATNFGTLPAIANAAAPTWTEGNQVAESTDLAGNQRIAMAQQLDKTNDSIATGWRGRTYLTFTSVQVASVSSIALKSFNKNAAGTVTATVTSYVVTSGKSFHIQAIMCEVRSSSATVAQFTTWELRHNTAGAAATNSAVVWNCEAQSGPIASTLQSMNGVCNATFGDYGLPIVGDGTGAIGLTSTSNSTNGVESCTITGYEAIDP